VQEQIRRAVALHEAEAAIGGPGFDDACLSHDSGHHLMLTGAAGLL
jgi:hypothetical protein